MDARALLCDSNPLGMPASHPVPPKDTMAEGHTAMCDSAGHAFRNQLKISTEDVHKPGVRTEAASMPAVPRTVHATGRIELDERRRYIIAPRFEGWIARLHANTTGQAIRSGQALFDVYSPQLNAAQREYAIAARSIKSMRGAGRHEQQKASPLSQASLARLRNLGVAERDLVHLIKSGKPTPTLTVRSPEGGIVMQKMAVRGMHFTPGETLYQIADLSSVWVVVDVCEQDIASIKPGQTATLRFHAYAGREFTARVSDVYRNVNQKTHTTPVRLQFANRADLFKPGMHVDAELAIRAGGRRGNRTSF